SVRNLPVSKSLGSRDGQPAGFLGDQVQDLSAAGRDEQPLLAIAEPALEIPNMLMVSPGQQPLTGAHIHNLFPLIGIGVVFSLVCGCGCLRRSGSPRRWPTP